MKESGPLAAAGLEEARPDSLGCALAPSAAASINNNNNNIIISNNNNNNIVSSPVSSGISTTTTAAVTINAVAPAVGGIPPSGTHPQSGGGKSGDSTNFEYEDSEWDVGIGNLIIDLDADIEKNNSGAVGSTTNNNNSSIQKGNQQGSGAGMPSGTSSNSGATGSSPLNTNNGSASAVTATTTNTSATTTTTGVKSGSSGGSNGATAGKMAAAAVHSATVEPGLKMKIKRTKPGPGTRSSETKHEIVKTSEGNSSTTTTTSSSTGSVQQPTTGTTSSSSIGSPTAVTAVTTTPTPPTAVRPQLAGANNNNNHNNNNNNNNNKRGPSANHKRDKSREKVTNPGGAVNSKMQTTGGSSSSSVGTSTTTAVTVTATASVTGMMTTSSGVTVTPVTVSGGGSPASLRAGMVVVPSCTTSSLTVTPVVVGTGGAMLPSSRTPPLSTTVVLPTGMVNGTAGGPTNGSSPTYGCNSTGSPVTVTPVGSNVLLNNLGGGGPGRSDALIVGSNKTSSLMTSTSCTEPPSPPANKKWRTSGHLVSDKVADPSPPPPALSTGTSVTGGNRSVTLLAVTPPSAGLLVNGVGGHNNPTMSVTSSSPSADGSPCSSHSTSCSSSLVVSRADACVGTCSASTMTEPECLGPCEPGTAVTLEGIVWHETEGGVLVVNVTWRGKTYVGTLMDCTKNDWAPPRFCDSPTSDAESRAPKGRAKRGRGATSTPVPTSGAGGIGVAGLADASLSPMHSKLRNGAKGRRGVGGGNGGSGLPAPPSPAKEVLTSGGKRKGSSSSGSGNGVKNLDDAANGSANKRSRSSSRGAGSSSPSMEPPAAVSTAASPMLIECPEPNCSKKYRHINGLKYHQSHAHGGISTVNTNGGVAAVTVAEATFDEDSNQDMTMVTPTKSGKEVPTTPQPAEEAMEVAPFTGKVPMPPPPETTSTSSSSSATSASSSNTVSVGVTSATDPGASPQKPPKPSSPRLPAPSPILLSTSSSSSSPSVIPTDVTSSPSPVTNGSSKPAVEHLFTPIVTQPLNATSTTTATTAPSSTTWTTLTPNPRSPAMAVTGTTSKLSGSDAESVERKERSKHKKKSKDKDRDRTERRDHAAKKSPGAPTVTANGSLYHNMTPAVPNPSSPASTATIGADPSAVNSLTSGIGATNGPIPVTDSNREDVQSPAYSDISDANDQSPSLLDAELLESKKVAEKLAAEAAACLPPVAGPGAGPGVHPALGSFSMYPFYGQPPFMPPTAADQQAGKMIMKPEERREDPAVKPIPAQVSGIPPHPPPPSSLPTGSGHPGPGALYQPPYGFIPPYPAYPMDPVMIDPSIPAARSTSKTPDQGGLGIPPAHSPRRIDSSPGRKDEKKPPVGTSVTPVAPIKSDPTSLASSMALPKDPIKEEMKKMSVSTPSMEKILPPSSLPLPGPINIPSGPVPLGPGMPGSGPPGSGPQGPGAFDTAMLYQRQHQEELRRFYNVYGGDDPMLGPGPGPPGMGMFQPPMNSPGSGGPGPGWMVNGPKSSPLDSQQPPSQQQQHNQQQQQLQQIQQHIHQQQQIHQQQHQQQFQQQLQHQLQLQHQQQQQQQQQQQMQQHIQNQALHQHLQQQQQQQQHHQSRKSSSSSKSSSSMPSSASSPKLRPPSVDRKQEQRDKEQQRPNEKISEGVKPTMETQGPPPPPGPPPGAGLSPYGMYPNLYPYGLPFDPSHPAYRNTMASMLGGSPHNPFGPDPRNGPSPFGIPHHPHQLSPAGMRGYPSGPGGFPGPSGEDLSRAHAIEMLQHQANQYYASLAGPPPPPSSVQQGGAPTSSGPSSGPGSQQSQSQQHKIHELAERAMKSPPASPAVGHDKNQISMGSGLGLIPPNPSTTPTGPGQMGKMSMSMDRRSPSMGSNNPPRSLLNSSVGPPGPPPLPPSSAGFLPPSLAASNHHQYPPSGSPYGGPKPLLRP